MARILQQYRGFNLLIENVPLNTRLKTLNILEFEEKKEEFNPGFSDMGIELGFGGTVPKLEFETIESDAENFALFGASPGTAQKFTAYKTATSILGTDKAAKQTIISVQGRILSAKADNHERTKAVSNKFMVGEIQRFRWVHDGQLLMNWDLATGGDSVKRGDLASLLGRYDADA